MSSVRLQKYLAKCGVGSRRTCETFIVQGRVKIDGNIVTTLGTKIDPSHQNIMFDDKEIHPKPISWIMVNKPPGYLSTAKDPSGKPTFLDLLPKDKHHLFAVGRLDFLSEGLLLITNDGYRANKLIHPRYEIEKEYWVITPDKINTEQLNRLKNGFTIQHDFLKVERIHQVNEFNIKNQWMYLIIIKEGKNRHIRRMLDYINIRIKKLRRVRIGPIKLTDLSIGEWRYLTKDEIKKIHGLCQDFEK
ncbi:MAG: rRNA pseudouridine synthase [Candidatus Thermoplasmatota archaeon]|nr:rRNA pseudouridine synthase [Candidatus Thermoplasmatota archaeon]MBS3801308.1 rRNA pseudouridine synthase [Candidatus Thermoplasmatota archaeon]